MRHAQLLIPTLKEDPREAETVSHRLLVRAGFIRKVAAGIYDYLPLAVRTIRKVETIVRDEMNRAGCQEILMPMVQPAQLWQDSGRWDKFGPELLRFKDRKGNDFALGPTHEEVVTDIVRREVRSYRQLPLNLYQIQTKFRDEVRPRAGLMRGREFIMKDGYSFDASEEAARRSYHHMFEAYGRIFRRCGFEFRAVEATTGAMGGNLSHEFQVLADSGEDLIVACDTCEYAANVEQAELLTTAPPPRSPSAERPMRAVDTPGKRTIEEVSAYLGLPPERFIKSLVYLADGEPVMVLVRGDHEVNEVKLARVLLADQVVLAVDATVEEVTAAPVGFAGPVGARVKTVADLAVMAVENGVTGANEADRHLVDVNPGRDFVPTLTADVRRATEGDQCPRCGGTYRSFRGIEVGQVFYLGTRYSVPMGATFLDEEGNERPMVMGCYGIGITRILAAAVEQHHDEDGIIWPMPLSPFQVWITVPSVKETEALAEAERLHGALEGGGVEVLLDDRDERAGVKFKDADLIGVPIRVAVGRKAMAEGSVEVKLRREREAHLVPLEDAPDRIVAMVKAEMERYR